MRKYLFLFIFILKGIFPMQLRAAPWGDSNSLLRINILSRHLRLLKEGSGGAIVFTFNENVKLHDNLKGISSETGYLKIYFHGMRWIVEVNGRSISSLFNLIAGMQGRNKSASVIINGEKRIYPLPLYIKSSGKGPKIIINENIYRYAFDSSYAEYGRVSEGELEAYYALAHIITARSFYRKNRAAHRDYDFCDLTHCQVYRGRHKRAEADYKSEGKPLIDWRVLKSELLFHSGCGGKTFDSRVFSLRQGGYKGVRDILYRKGIILCRNKNSGWERRIRADELYRILNPAGYNDHRELSLAYDIGRLSLTIDDGYRSFVTAPETFRLTVNRVKGWNFIKSNNYRIYEEKTGKEKFFLFKGQGLGHGAGFCQHGALELSRRGYSAFEIINHYYRGVRFFPSLNKGLSHSVSYSLFDPASGHIIKISSRSLLNRKFPPGSLWKIIVSLYIARERQDIFNDYYYECKGINRGKDPLPERCWKKEGHCRINLEGALSNSCNLFFASLYNRIGKDRLYEFYRESGKYLGLSGKLPEISGQREWASLLAGLNFSINFSLRDLIKIAGLIYPETNRDEKIESFRKYFPVQYRLRIFQALTNTFIKGTAMYPAETSQRIKKKYNSEFSQDLQKILLKSVEGLWGKTSTVIDGTNIPLSYGMFLGGYKGAGVVVFLRKGTGHMAAQWGKILLLRKFNGE